MPKRNRKGPAKPVSVADDSETSKPERIAKRMARAGLCSRRDAERWIEDGRVRVNGKVLKTPAFTVSATDRIEVDGEALPIIDRTRLWLLHKKAGYVTTDKDPEGRPTVRDLLPAEIPRTVTVGRLDINTEGLLLLTNDGGLARVLELPSTGWLRRYRVRAHGTVRQEQLDQLKDGVAVDGVLYGSIEAELERIQGSNVWLTFAMREGKNREVRNVLSSLGLEVNRLIRVSYGPFQLGDLPPGKVSEVRSRTLREQLGPKLIEQAGTNFDAPLQITPALKKEPAPKGKITKRKTEPLANIDTQKPARGKGAKRRGREKSNADRRR